MAYVTSIANQKGGVGKTTTAVNLSTAMAAIKKKALLIDLDPQGNATTGLGVSKGGGDTIYELLFEKTTLDAVCCSTVVPGLDLIRSSIHLAGAEIELVHKHEREKVLSRLLSEVSYDYVYIDCPPALGLLTLNALVASDSVIVPLQCEYYALEGLSQILKTIKRVTMNLNTKLVLEGVLLTMFDTRNSLSSSIENEVRSHLGDQVFKTIIPRNVRVSEAPSHGLPAMLYDFKSVGSQAYIKLAREIVRRYERVMI